MFDLESQIASWRQSFQQQKLDEATLAELESHLCDLFANLRRGDATDEQAWQQAVAGLGDAKAVATEFRKAPGFVWWPTLFAVCLVTLAGAGAFAMTLKRGVHNLNAAILLTHVTTITVGYTAMFATGLLAICSLVQRAIKRWDAQREASFRKHGLIFGQVAVFTVSAGILLGSLWTSRTRHVFWNRDAREIGGELVWFWTFCLVEVFRRSRFSPALRLITCFVATAITAAAWFGPLIIEARHAYGLDNLSLKLGGFIALNAVLSLFTWLLPDTKRSDVESVKAD